MENSFIFRKEWLTVIETLTDAERLAFYDAIMAYAFDKRKPVNKLITVATRMVFEEIDKMNAKYQAKIEQTKEASRRRWGGIMKNPETSPSAPPVEEKTTPPTAPTPSAEVEQVVEKWNASAPRGKGIKFIRGIRRQRLEARIKESGVEQVLNAINEAFNSQFLKNGAFFNFDWLIRPNNFDKITAGNYRDKENKNTSKILDLKNAVEEAAQKLGI